MFYYKTIGIGIGKSNGWQSIPIQIAERSTFPIPIANPIGIHWNFPIPIPKPIG